MTDSTSSAGTPDPTPPGSETTDDFRNTSLDSLQTADQLKLLDTMDKLRSYGVSEYVSLPQIIVCGDQSAGKSSVLEAITQVPFPRKENLCTRFATQIVLRRSPISKVSVTILPDTLNPPTPEIREKLANYSASLKDFTALPGVIDAAGDAMGIGASGATFSQHVLNIEISGPTQPHLTVVDLPGLIHAGSSSQGESDVKIVSALVGNYMKNPRTIILAVVTAMNDYQNQIVLSRAKEVDPEGKRTLGIITKPDTLNVGSDNEDAFISLARNEKIFFGLGWHVLRNRNFNEKDTSFEERNANEELFFATGAWAKLDRECVGIGKLRERLSKLLYAHIKTELPKVYADIKNGYDDCVERLGKLGRPRTTVEEMRRFMSELSMDFVHMCKAAVEGNYEHPFFGEGIPPAEEDWPKRLRAVAQNMGLLFANTLRKKGHTYEIRARGLEIDIEDNDSFGNSMLPEPEVITPNKAVQWVTPLIERSRGRELPGSYNPLLIGNLFWEQSKHWDEYGKNHLQLVHEACDEFIRLLLPALTHKDLSDAIYAHVLQATLSQRLEAAKLELKKVLQDRRNHPITYNHYYTENIQKERMVELKKELEEAWESCGYPLNSTNYSMNGVKFMEKMTGYLERNTILDMDEYAAKEVLRCMQAYYKVAFKCFIDNLSVLVVERHLLASLWDIFSPITVMEMSDEQVRTIAAESPESSNLRSMLQIKKSMLEKGVIACDEVRHGSTVEN